MTQHSHEPLNIAHRLRATARRMPFKKAVVQPVGRDGFGRTTYSHLTFRQLDAESDRLAFGLESIGIQRGVKTILMVTPSIEFFVLIFAMFKTGAVPVVVDPGMGLKRMLSCLDESGAEAFIGIPKAHLLRVLAPRHFKTVQTWVTVGRKYFWGGASIKRLWAQPGKPYPLTGTCPDDMAAILFTTGSTGPAKGAVYTHGNFDAQIAQIQDHFQIEDHEIDLPTFPLFALFDPALGMTAVIPDMDPTKPGFVDPRKIIDPIISHGVTNMFGSPALLNRVGRWGQARRIKLPSLKRVVSAGAPVTPVIIERFSSMLTGDTQIHTPYGATEAVPIASIGSREILAETKELTESGHGMCVGRPLSRVDIRILKITDDPIETWSDDLLADQGEIGEITVKGDLVTKGYYRRPEADASAKIHRGEEIWHRMGDLGYFDSQGRLWFCGRKSHRVQTRSGTLFTEPTEAIFNNHPHVFRSALVGVGAVPEQRPVLCIEPEKHLSRQDKSLLEKELLDMARNNDLTRSIETVLFHDAFPVDIRHNSKIFREKLAIWAENRIE